MCPPFTSRTLNAHSFRPAPPPWCPPPNLSLLCPQSAGVMMCTTLYMIFGLALTSMCINVIQEKMTLHFKHASIKLGTRFGVSVPVTPAPPPVVEVAPVHGKEK